MSETSALMDTLRQEGVSPDLLRAVEEYRASHELSEALRPRIPSPAFVYYGREVWEQALAALLCGKVGKRSNKRLVKSHKKLRSV